MRVLKWVGIVLGSLVALVAIAAVVAGFRGEGVLAANHADEPHQTLTAAGDVERGRYLVEDLIGCAACHGEGLAGVEDLMAEFEGGPSALGTLAAPNLTPNGVGGRLDSEDWVRAIRHGIGADGRRLVVMPSASFATLSDEDLAAIVAYLETVPGAGEPTAGRSFSWLGRVLIGAGMFPDEYALAADVEPVDVPRGPTLEHGRYLAEVMCFDCFIDFSGWTKEDFATAVYDGTLPDGSPINELDPDDAPLADIADDDFEALWLFVEDAYGG